MSGSADLAGTVRRTLVERCRAIPSRRVAVFLSGGLDSTAVALAAILAGKQVRAYTFRLDGTNSTDFRFAVHNADELGVDLVEVVVPSGDADAKAAVLRSVHALGLRKKTAIECTWPRTYLVDAVREKHVLTGDGSDPYFALSKKGALHFRQTAALMDEYRRKLDDPDYAQRRTTEKLLAARGRRLHMPWGCVEMRAAFAGRTWEDVNRPRQKQPIRDAFRDELRELRTTGRLNMQLGDSGIAARLSRLVDDPLMNPGGRYTSVVGVYNLAARRAAMRAVIVGQAPAKTGDPGSPLMGAFGHKLARLAGLEFPEEYAGAFELANLLPQWPGPSSRKGDLFPLAEARRRAERMRRGLEGRAVVFAGSNVAKAFGHRADLLAWAPCGGMWAASMPHPSGVNLWWNDPRNRARAGKFLREAAERGGAE